ncbi:hypothetical protein LX36DRAFT_673953 [Colletotrichum falcatum]|nr:hypothetical protein LX36DRAFT_673953 [Colletotrichum falcatum]
MVTWPYLSIYVCLLLLRASRGWDGSSWCLQGHVLSPFFCKLSLSLSLSLGTNHSFRLMAFYSFRIMAKLFMRRSTIHDTALDSSKWTSPASDQSLRPKAV